MKPATDLPAPDPIAAAVAARKREREQHAPGDQVPDRHREERRQVADRDRERDERRAPDEVHRHEGEPDPHAVPRSHRVIVPCADDQLKSSWPQVRSDR